MNSSGPSWDDHTTLGILALAALVAQGCVPVPLPAIPPVPQASKEHHEGLRSIALSEDGRFLFSSSADGAVVTWDLESRQPVGQPVVGPREGVVSAAFSPDGHNVAFASRDGTVTIWDLQLRRPLREFPEQASRGATSVAFGPDGRALAVGSRDGKVLVWDTVERRPLGPHIVVSRSAVERVAFSPDGRVLATATASAITLWDFQTRVPLGAPLNVRGHLSRLAFSPDGRRLAASGGEVSLWDVETHHCLWLAWEGPSDAIALSPDGKTIALGRRDGHVELWNTETKQRVADLKGHGLKRWALAGLFPGGPPLPLIPGAMTMSHLNVDAVIFSLDGKTLVSGGDDAAIIFWDVATRLPMAAGGQIPALRP